MPRKRRGGSIGRSTPQQMQSECVDNVQQKSNVGQKQTKRQFLGKNVFHHPFRFYSHQICSHTQTHKWKNGHQTNKSKNAFNHSHNHHHQRYPAPTQTLRTHALLAKWLSSVIYVRLQSSNRRLFVVEMASTV